MRALSVVIATASMAGLASAQPAPAGPPGAPPPVYQPGYGPPPNYGPPLPYAYQPQVALTEEDRDLLAQGEITDGQKLGGGLAAVFLGLGVGQAIEGRYMETGWIFTVGETASMVALMWGFFEQFNDTSNNQATANALFFGGMIGVVGFRVWEVIDAFTGPPAHNTRLHMLRMRLGMPPSPNIYGHVGPYLAPPAAGGGGGGVAGVTLRF